MVNKQKSKCQLRLEARSRACFAPTSASSDPQLLAAELQSRIARANDIRAMHTRQLAARARARVQHAQEVARGMRMKRHEEIRVSRQSSISKVEEAARRRHQQLVQLQLQCKKRTELITEKVELVRANQSDRADRARRTLADQLDEATRRRHEQTQQRVRRLIQRWQSVESVKERATRVKYIQRWFRRHVANRKTATALRKVQQDVKKVLSCWNQMKTASFENCMILLQQRTVVQAAQQLLKVLMAEGFDHRKVNILGEKPVETDTKRMRLVSSQGGMSFRVLMMAGMITCHPMDIMGRNPSKRLHYAASGILSSMKNLMRCLEASDGFERSQELTQTVAGLSARFAFYTEAFARWKKRDAECLAAELLTTYRELSLVYRKYEMQAQEAQNGVDGVYELLRQTQGQLVQMQMALEKLVGRDDAKRKVVELEQSLRQEDGAGNAPVDADDMSVNVEGDNNPLSSEATVVSTTRPVNVGERGDQDKKDDDMRGHDVADDKVSGGDPPSVNQALLADRKLVHELIMNPHFQVQRDKDAEVSAAALASKHSVAAMAVRVRKAMTKAFWDRVIAANDVETLLARTEELRTIFREALADGSGTNSGIAVSALVDQVDSALHSDQLRMLMQDPMRNVRAIHARCNGVLDAIEKAEAPARAASTREFRSDWANRVAAGIMTPVQLLVAFLAFALDKVDELRIDVLNSHLGLLGAFLQQHGVEYEQKQLYKRMSESKSLDVTFAMTQKWLGLEMEAYLARSDVDESEHARLLHHEGEAFKRFLRASIWALVVKHIDGTPTRVWPETFELDVERIRACRDTLDRIAVVSSLLALVQDYVARRSLATPAGFIHTVGHRLSALLLSPGVSGAQLAAQASQDVRQVESSGDEDVQQELQALEKRLLGSFAADNPVFKLFFSRASRAFEASLQQGNAMDDLHPSLAPFATEISETSSVLRRLAQHNENVYASLYNKIIKRLVPSRM
ncbi:unnamed protein product [Peronospora effusa]|nr:unnamed protein product [Peronospora effusa]